MEAFVRLVESLESRPDDADRVALVAGWLSSAGREAGDEAAGWLVREQSRRTRRPPRSRLDELTEAAAALAQEQGMARWLFDAGLAASAERTEALACLLPWPCEPARTPTLGEWTAAWRLAASVPDPFQRARAVMSSIASFDDGPTRRWALRAAGGLVRPLLTAWQWQRAWARAFGDDPQVLAWVAYGGHADQVPWPCRLHAHPEWSDADAPMRAALFDDWRAGRAWAEPHWQGERVQVVRRGAAVAVWHASGELLNARLPPVALDAARWPDPCAVEAVLVERGATRVEDHRATVGAPANATRAIAEPSAKTAGKAAGKAPTASASGTSHLVAIDWIRWGDRSREATPAAERRAMLAAALPLLLPDGPWPTGDSPDRVEADWPQVAVTPAWACPGDVPLAGGGFDARPEWLEGNGRRGLVLRVGESRSIVQPLGRCVLAVLLYVPRAVLAADTSARLALRHAVCGFSVWNRAPLSEDERRAAMALAATGEFLPESAEAGALPALRLLPLGRLELALSVEECERLLPRLRADAGQRFGDTQAVLPTQVFEVTFSQARVSRRHRLGAVIDDARVRRWVETAPAGGADTARSIGAD